MAKQVSDAALEHLFPVYEGSLVRRERFSYALSRSGDRRISDFSELLTWLTFETLRLTVFQSGMISQTITARASYAMHEDLAALGTFLIVEYERSMPTPWRPYPVGFERLQEIFKDVGVERLEKLATQPSRFGGTMYSTLAKQSIAK
jgi:hypothetical protein